MSRSARLHRWEGVDVATLRERWGLPALVVLSETTSTNDIARRMAAQGAPAGLLAMAEHQTAGRGRMRRHWSDSPGRSLLLSFVLRPDVREATGADAATAPGTAPLRVGMALVDGLNNLVAAGLRIKWPNDIVFNERKIAGILCEASSAGGDTVIAAGIGINVSQSDEDWRGELRGSAASLASVSGQPLPGRLAIMDAIVAAIRPLFTRPLSPLGADELLRFNSLDALPGRDVVVDGGLTRGVASGIAPDGALLISSDGALHRITSGTVRIVAPHSYPFPEPR